MTTGARARVQIADGDVTGIAVASGGVVIEARGHECSVVLDERVVRRALAVIEADWALRAFADDALDGSGL